MWVPMDITPNPKHVERAAQMLIEAKSPIMHVGHEVWTSGGRADVVELAELLTITVVQAWSWAADFPTDHPLYLGGYLDPMRYPDPIDLFLNLGANLPDPGSSPTAIPRTAKIIHTRVDSRQLGADYPVDLAIVADVKETARALTEAIRSMATQARLATLRQTRWSATKTFTDRLKQSYLTAARNGWDESPLTWPRLLLTLNGMLDGQTIIVAEAGTDD